MTKFKNSFQNTHIYQMHLLNSVNKKTKNKTQVAYKEKTNDTNTSHEIYIYISCTEDGKFSSENPILTTFQGYEKFQQLNVEAIS